MKIGFFTDSYRPYMSGVVKSIDSFSKNLRAKGHEVFIFAPDYPDRKDKDDNIYRFKSLPTFSGTNFRLAIPFTTKLLSGIDKFDLDIIHSHSPFLLGWLGKIIARKNNIPLVFTYHTLYEKYAHYIPLAPELIKKLAVKHTNRYCSACSVIITPSDYVQEKLKMRGINIPMITIPTGIEIDEYRNRENKNIRGKYGIDDKDKVLLFVGRLGEEKNVEFLLNTFREIKNKIKGVKLMLVGDGPRKKKLEKLSQIYAIQDLVIFTGWQPPEKVIDFYLASDLFIFPSKTETQGLVTLEAMAAGLPVVAVNAAGSKKMVDDGEDGFLVKAEERVFSAAVIDLLTHEKKYNIFAHNARRKGEKYSMSNLTDKLIATYKGLLARRVGYNKYLA